MRRLVPSRRDLELDGAYADLVLPAPAPGDRRARTALGMVASVDGAVAVDGTSSGLGGAADRVAFRRLRAACDAIVVGAGTVRAEDYGPVPTGPDRIESRRAAGLSPAPQLVVVTDRVSLSPDARLFTAPRDPAVPRPVVVTHRSAPAERIEALRPVAEVVQFGDREVDLDAMLVWCVERGLGRVLVEGGPQLAAALAAEGLLDEVFLTLAPVLVGGGAGRMLAGPTLQPPTDLELVEVHEHGGELLLRYRLQQHGRPSGRNVEDRC